MPSGPLQRVLVPRLINICCADASTEQTHPLVKPLLLWIYIYIYILFFN